MELIDIRKRLLELKAWEIQLDELQSTLFHEIVMTQDRRARLESKAVDMGIEFY